jgi:hypothetical protein
MKDCFEYSRLSVFLIAFQTQGQVTLPPTLTAIRNAKLIQIDNVVVPEVDPE